MARAKPRKRTKAVARPRRHGRAAGAVLAPHPAEPATDALLALSRELADARDEARVTRALAQALEALFPGRSYGIRLLDPDTLAVRTFYGRGKLRHRPSHLSLRVAAVERTGLSRAALERAGVHVGDADEPLFEGCDEALVVPLAVGGQLFGVLNLEYPAAGNLAGFDRHADAPLLFQLANHAGLGIRNVRSFEQLTTLKNHLEDLLEHANALIFVVNRRREVTVWNAALVKLTGFPRERVVGGELLALLPEAERRGFDRVILQGFGGTAVASHRTRLRCADGSEASVAVNTAPVRGSGGEIEGVVAIGDDLTLLLSLQAAAEHAERLAGIGRLVAGVVHELNNPLTAVNMYSDVLVEKLTAAAHDPADLEKLRAIREAGQRIQRLARDLVAYARPAGARTEPVELAGVLDEAARLAKPALKETAAMLDRELGDVPAIDGSRPALVQVFVNLVTNAARALRPGGHVRLRLAPGEAGEVRVVVEDDGVGMEPDVARRAFEPFFTTRPGSGIGLGLPIVRGIVERHGGRVALDTAPGAGTRVTVTLPVRRGQDAAR